MPLRRSPRLTPESLATRRANALKSSGPRTARRKARVSLNALKHGRYAAGSARLRERLIQAGYGRQEVLYGQIRSRIAQAFGAQNPAARRWADQLATKVWCLATRPKARKRLRKTKLESPAEPIGWTVRVSSHCGIGRFRFGVPDDWRRIGLLFWVQRKRYRTLECVERVLLGLEEPAPPGPEEGLEDAVRSLVFRLRRPGAIERFRYSLDANGDPDWDREPWSSLRGRRRAPGAGSRSPAQGST